MTHLPLIVSLLLAAMPLMSMARQRQPEPVRVIPVPMSVRHGHGSFTIDSDTRLATNLKGRDRRQLEAWLKGQQGLLARPLRRASCMAPGTIALIKTTAWGAAGPTSHEAYTLSVTRQGIEIRAAGAAGLFYGLQTLLQMARDTGPGTWQVSCADIADKPRFAYRGFMIDVSRHFRSKQFLMRQIDALSRYKINHLHLHLTDAAGWRLEIKRYPLLTQMAAWRKGDTWKQWWQGDGRRRYCHQADSGAYGGYYTQEDMRQIVEYAARRHITVVPEIEMPSHSEEVLAAYPHLSCLGRPYHNADFCVGNDSTFTFIEDVLREVMDIFPSRYIHIGGDEAGKQAWRTCPKCQQRMAREGLQDVDRLQSYMIGRVARFLAAAGRQLMGWDEIMQGTPVKGATVMWWHSPGQAERALDLGHRVVMSPGAYCYLDAYQDAPPTQPEAMGGYLPLERVYSFDPAPPSLTPARAANVIGVQGNLWAEYVVSDSHYEYMMYPRALALAEVGWSAGGGKSYDAFRQSAVRETRWLADNGYHPFPLASEVGPRPESLTTVSHLARGCKVTYNAPYNDSYAARGDTTLTDGRRGGWSYADGAWQGFISKGRLDVTIDLGKVTPVTSVEATFMQVAGPEIFLPAGIRVMASADGVTYQSLASPRFDVDGTTPVAFTTCGWHGKVQARYIRYMAQSDTALRGWIFTDEIIVR